jgi:hypothetical protein
MCIVSVLSGDEHPMYRRHPIVHTQFGHFDDRWTPLLRKIAEVAAYYAGGICPQHRWRILAALRCGQPSDFLVRLKAVVNWANHAPSDVISFGLNGGPLFGGDSGFSSAKECAYTIYWRFSVILGSSGVDA